MWTSKLRKNYEERYEVWASYAEMYGLHLRLGFKTPEEAWEANPTIQGSTNPDDFKIVEDAMLNMTKTVIEVIVLRVGAIPEGTSLASIAKDIVDGDSAGAWKVKETDFMSDEDMERELEAIGASPEFFSTGDDQ
jgi:hypothetical protein